MFLLMAFTFGLLLGALEGATLLDVRSFWEKKITPIWGAERLPLVILYVRLLIKGAVSIGILQSKIDEMTTSVSQLGSLTIVTE